ncbi:hypothetical protein TSUD_65780 [Trifolium subterraneum]|uniref:Pterin-binding domain-containing protein n=1 Tax=Trifolium subterraneum TaxID=3900 RepID=A0A2Z6MFL1_TRISU|nr:hypothetical protein TSUD_65780 [Trifolium subterraneum]
MSTRGSWITLKFRGMVDVVRASRFQSSYGGIKRNTPIVSTTRVQSSYWMQPSMQFFSTKRKISTNANRLKNGEVQPEAPASKISTFSSWVKWVLCSFLSLVLPFWSQYWVKLQRIEGEAEIVIEGVEKVAEVVEKVANVAEKISEDVAEMLPENGELKKVALVVETASKQASRGAQTTEEFIHKVEEVVNDMEDLESFIEPVIDKIVKKETSKD